MTDALLPRQRVQAAATSFDAVVLGEGPLTVVFVNGLGAPLEEWALVAPTIAKSNKVVCYDRRPAPRRGPLPTHDAAQMADDLHHLLAALGVSGPLVLVGHSWGGAMIRRYTIDHPDDVAGMVFVDASHENIKGMMPTRATRALYVVATLPLRAGPIRRRLLRTLGFSQLPPGDLEAVQALGWLAEGRTSLAEYGGIRTSLMELGRVAPELPPVPAHVLLAGGRPGLMMKFGARQLAGIRAVWEKAVDGRSEVKLETVAGSGHYISLDRPQAVIDAIEDVIGRVAPGR